MAKKKAEKAQEKKAQEPMNIEDIEKIVIELGKKGHHPAEIGSILKEKHGIYDIKVLGKKISKILKNAKINYKSDLDFVSEKLSKITNHYEKNKQDKRAMREKDRVFAQLRKIKVYHKIPLK